MKFVEVIAAVAGIAASDQELLILKMIEDNNQLECFRMLCEKNTLKLLPKLKFLLLSDENTV